MRKLVLFSLEFREVKNYYKAIYIPKQQSTLQATMFECVFARYGRPTLAPTKKGGEFMKKETMEYLMGERNVAIDEFIVGREKAGDTELIFISLPEHDMPLYALWNSKKTTHKYKKIENDGEIKFERITPKGTGGKEAYVMLMSSAISVLNKSQISLDAAGFILKASDYIEWNTGRICRKRDGKPMTREMLSHALNIGNSKLRTITKELTTLGVIRYDKKKRSYFVDTKYIRKGAAFDED